MLNDLTIRTATRAEVNLLIDWAAAEGWNPGRYDAECFYQTNQQGFLVGVLNDQVIGCISAIAYDQHFGFIGLYIVKPEFRGRGLGLKIWKAGMAHLGSTRNIELDGVLAQQENYKKSGFQLAYRHIRYQGRGGGDIPPNVVPLSTVPFEELVAYDRRFFPAERPRFLQSWIQQPESVAWGVLSADHLVGYGMIRVCRTGFRIGPLFALQPQIAEDLFQALIANCPDALVFLDVPDVNSVAIALCERHSMQPIFETARMYTQKPPTLPISQIFGVTTLEFG